MGYLDACSFSFNGTSSKIYGLRICWEGGESNVETGLGREIVKGEVNMVRHRANQYGTKYSETIPLEFMVIKYDGSDFTRLESRTINRWLQTDTYCPLRFDDGDGGNIYYKAICTGIEDRVYGGFCCKNLKFECDSPFGYEAKKIFTKSDSETSMRIFNSSDDGIYYPIFVLNATSSDITITNETDDGNAMEFTIDEDYLEQDITIDTANMQILDANGVPIPFYKLGWTIGASIDTALQSTSIYWLRLVEKINRITITGTCTISMTCEFPRKAGAL